MTESSHIESIAERSVHALDRLSWTVQYKQRLLERCLLRGERQLAAELHADIAELEAEAIHHRVAIALVRAMQQ